MSVNVEVGKVYKHSKSRPSAFGKVFKITEQQVWDEEEEGDKLSIIAWADWYQWIDRKVYCIHNAGFETDHLVKATSEEIAVYEKKKIDYKFQEEYGHLG